jgi:aminoglycoside phosphotransferase family enzyme/predicted kinase
LDPRPLSGFPTAAVPTKENDLVAFQQDAVLAFVGLSEAGMKRVDTHASIIFLGKERVLKIKRAIRLPFLDYSTLAKRRIACQAELEVNMPFAPDLYRRVIPITHHSEGFSIDGEGSPVEWAVEMKRFDETAGLDRIAAKADITPELAEQISDAILNAHNRANHDSHAASNAQRTYLERRADAGFVRRCHGDLHLGNITLIDGKPVLFDAIEFDPAIATTDVLYDLGFVLMDLIHHGQRNAANVLFNRYLTQGDPSHLAALAVFPLFLSIRAAIRAHVLFTRAEQSGGDQQVAAEAKRYFELAIQLIRPPPGGMIAIGGLSGTGKSVLARAVAPSLGPAPGAVVVRSDVIRKAMFGAHEHSRLPGSAYAAEVTEQVYDELISSAGRIASHGHAVVLDAAFLRQEERRAFTLAEPRTVLHIGLFLHADLSVRLNRIAGRHNDASDASTAVAHMQEHLDTDHIEWPLIDAGGTPEETHANAAPHLTPLVAPHG